MNYVIESQDFPHIIIVSKEFNIAANQFFFLQNGSFILSDILLPVDSHRFIFGIEFKNRENSEFFVLLVKSAFDALFLNSNSSLIIRSMHSISFLYSLHCSSE